MFPSVSSNLASYHLGDRNGTGGSILQQKEWCGMFKLSGYWKTWNRVLAEEDGLVLELNLSPVNGWHRGKLTEVKNIVFRIHGTYSQDDTYRVTPPENLVKDMREFLGVDETKHLLETDFYSLLKDDLGVSSLGELYQIYRKHANGGLSWGEFERIRLKNSIQELCDEFHNDLKHRETGL